MSEKAVMIELNPRERRLYDRLRGRFIERSPGERKSQTHQIFWATIAYDGLFDQLVYRNNPRNAH